MATLGPNSAGTGADDSSFGNIAWVNPGNITSSNDSYATNSGTPQHYLKATNFGFSVPADATINGITVEIERKKVRSNGTNTCKDARVRIVKSDGSIGTTDKADTATDWPTTDTYKTYGGSSDLWGETWTATDINDVDFGVVLSATLTVASESSCIALVDHVRITIDYTAAGVNSSTTQFLQLLGLGT